MKYIGEVEKEIVGFGVYKPGEVVEFNSTLFETGLFEREVQEGVNE
jgi:hypothetical protein